MVLLSAEGLSKQYAENILFSELNLGIHEGDKIALVAKNGAGKTTLLNILSGIDFPDAGIVTLRDGKRMALLPQEPDFSEFEKVQDVIDGFDNHVAQIIRVYHEALKEQELDHSSISEKKLEEASNAMDSVNGWDYERRLKAMLDRFNITKLDQKVGSLSGGQKKRLSMALSLLDTPDLLLLDEPTNHLDIDMIQWLEKYLNQSHINFMMVTHDRYFLNRVCNQIIEIEHGNSYSYPGNYEKFLELKEKRIEIIQTEVDKARKLMKKEQEWINRMPKARTTKSKARIDSFELTKEKASSFRPEKELKIEIKQQRVGGKILEMEAVTKTMGGQILINNFSYIFKKGERIGILGPNGAGKSTLLNLITGALIPDTGTITVGDTIEFGYYHQEGLRLPEDQRVIDVVREIAEVIPMGKEGSLTASQFLHRFLFGADKQIQPIFTLSGGEKRRLYLLTVLLKNPNFLILDEPTNDLDLQTLQKLEEFLENYTGCLIMVSHDRYFLDHVTDHLFVFEQNRIKDFPGNYTQYWENQQVESQINRTEKKTDKPTPQSKKTPAKGRLSFNEKREFEELELLINQLDTEKAELLDFMNQSNINYESMQEAGIKYSKLIEELDEKTLRWMELAEKGNL